MFNHSKLKIESRDKEMSEFEHCRLAHEGKLDALIEKIQSNHVENLPRKKDQVKAANLKSIIITSI